MKNLWNTVQTFHFKTLECKKSQDLNVLICVDESSMSDKSTLTSGLNINFLSGKIKLIRRNQFLSFVQNDDITRVDV